MTDTRIYVQMDDDDSGKIYVYDHAGHLLENETIVLPQQHSKRTLVRGRWVVHHEPGFLYIATYLYSATNDALHINRYNIETGEQEKVIGAGGLSGRIEAAFGHGDYLYVNIHPSLVSLAHWEAHAKDRFDAILIADSYELPVPEMNITLKHGYLFAWQREGREPTAADALSVPRADRRSADPELQTAAMLARSAMESKVYFDGETLWTRAGDHSPSNTSGKSTCLIGWNLDGYPTGERLYFGWENTFGIRGLDTSFCGANGKIYIYSRDLQALICWSRR